jgi:4-hydroxybenzoate polyprenyltransferase
VDALDKLIKETQAGLCAFLGVCIGFLVLSVQNVQIFNDGPLFVLAFLLFMGFGFMVGAFFPKK